MLIDLHNHTNLYSACSILTPEKLIENAIKANIDAVVITEHDKYFDRNKADNILADNKEKLKIFIGTEISISNCHILQFGERIPTGPYPDFATLFNEVKNKTSALVLAHPFRWDIELENMSENKIAEFFKTFNAVEVRSCNITPSQQTRLINICKNFNIKMVAGSDAHSVNMTSHYATYFKNYISNETELAKAILNNKYSPIIISNY